MIEILVAFAIMAMSLAVVYRAMGGSIRDVGKLEQRQKAVAMANALLNAHSVVLPGESDSRGNAAGLGWQVSIQPFPTEVETGRPGSVPLRRVVVVVSWVDAGVPQTFELRTLRPERKVELK